MFVNFPKYLGNKIKKNSTITFLRKFHSEVPQKLCVHKNDCLVNIIDLFGKNHGI
jgi:hypothetical protein